MARRQRQLVPQLRQRELGIRPGRLDAPSHRQHQRSSHQGERAQIPLAPRPPPRRSSFAKRSRAVSRHRGSRRLRSLHARWQASVLRHARELGTLSWGRTGHDRKQRRGDGARARPAAQGRDAPGANRDGGALRRGRRSARCRARPARIAEPGARGGVCRDSRRGRAVRARDRGGGHAAAVDRHDRPRRHGSRQTRLSLRPGHPLRPTRDRRIRRRRGNGARGDPIHRAAAGRARARHRRRHRACRPRSPDRRGQRPPAPATHAAHAADRPHPRRGNRGRRRAGNRVALDAALNRSLPRPFSWFGPCGAPVARVGEHMTGTFRLRTLIAVVGVGSFLAGCGYNTIPTLEEQAKARWGDVQNQYQRRADLIPNLVATVQGYAKQEKDVLTSVVEASAKATQVKVDASQLSDPDKLKQFQDAQNQLSGALGRLLAITENYPDLKSNANFLALQSQLEGTENRISVARRDYIEAVRAYNTALRTFPTLIWAKTVFSGSKPMAEFTAAENAQSPPQVKF